MYILTLTNKKTNEVYVYDNVKDNNEGEKLYYRFQIDVQNLEDGEYDLECTKDGVLVGVNTLYIGDYQTHSLQYKRGENTFIDITLNAKLEEVVAEIDTTQTTITPNEEFDGISKIEINAQPVFDNGYAEGFESGNTEGFENGYSSGRTDGYTEGYEVGERTGVNEFVNGLPTLTITQNGVYNETNKGVTVNVQTVDNSYFTGDVDESGLREIGWDDADIANFRDNINIYSWQNENYKVSDANKALYGVINANNIGDYANDPNLVFLPKFDGYAKSNISSSYLKGMPLIHLKYTDYEPLWFRFPNCVNLETVPPFEEEFYSTWETFENCKSLKSIPNLKTRNVTDMRSMFNGCTRLQTIPLLDTSSVINMERMFENCSSLEEVPLLDTSNVTNMSRMFVGCKQIKKIPSFNTSNVTNMANMFQDTMIETIPSFDTSNVTNMANMFKGSGIKRIPDLDVPKVKQLDYFTNECNVMEEIGNINSINAEGFSNCIGGWNSLRKIGTIQMQNAVNIGGFFQTYLNYNKLTDVGGFIGLKLSWGGNHGLGYCPNLTYQSCINILNGLYDFTGNGETPASNQGQLQVHQNFLNLVGDEISIGTSKGWIIYV